MSAKKLPKKVLMANLIALATEQASHDDEHRAKFDKIIERIRSRLCTMSDASELVGSGLHMDFSDAVRIAKMYLRMSKEEFVQAVSVLNTRISRVVDTCPSGKDVRDLPGWMLMTAEELRLSFSLLSPYEATGFIAEKGAMWGYTAAEIARAKKEHKPLEYARLAKRDAEDKARQEAETARIAARPKAGYTSYVYNPAA